MPLTREDLDLIDLIKTDLKGVNDPCTLEQLCQNSKQLCRRLDKVRQCLVHMVANETVEKYGEEYMLAENVTDIIRDQWLNEVLNRVANLTKRKWSDSSYAEVVKRRESAPDMMGGACGSDSQEKKVYKRSASDILPGGSDMLTPATAVREELPVQPTIHHHHHHHEHNTVVNHHNTVVNPLFVCGPQYNQFDFNSNNQNVFHPGDNANIQIGYQNEINYQESPKRQPPKKGKRRK